MSSLTDAYAVLGLSQGCTLEEVKAKYKQVALRTHPDKNPDNPDATIEFQRVSEAYRVISSHHESDDNDDEYEYDYDSDEDLMDIYMYIYSRLMNERRHSGPGYRHFKWREPESEEEYEERMRRNMEEQTEEAERRKTANEARKAYEKQEREKGMNVEKQRSDKRRKRRKKKYKQKEKRKKAEQTAQMLQQRTQSRRSAVFQAAREGDADKVKRGIYELSVDASGGEVKPGCEKFVKNQPKDSQETLLHISIKNGDADLVEYLDKHNAEPDERNSDGLTPVHLAIASGDTKIIKFFFETYPPKDPDHESIYRPPEGQNLLTLALQSLDSGVLNFIFSNILWSAEDAKFAWDWACSKNVENMGDILAVLKRYGDFSETESTDSNVKYPEEEQPRPGNDRGRGRGRGPWRGRGRGRSDKRRPPRR